MKSEITSRKSPTKIVFIGAGNMAEAMARGILASNIYRPGDMLAADIDKSRLAFFRRKLGIKGLADNKKAAATAEIIVLAVKPQQAPQVLDDLRGNLQGNPLLISIVTGFSVKKIADALAMPPRIIRVVPNTPALAGTGASAYCRGRAATARDEKLAARILNSIGVAVRLDEPLMNAATALSGSGPAYTLYLIEALLEAGRQMGLPDGAARLLTIATVGGTACLQVKTGLPAEELRRRVTSRGGTTAAAVKILDRAGTRRTIIAAVKAAHRRAQELS